MKGAEPRVARPGAALAQAHVLADNLHNVDGRLQLFDEVHGPRIRLLSPNARVTSGLLQAMLISLSRSGCRSRGTEYLLSIFSRKVGPAL